MAAVTAASAVSAMAAETIFQGRWKSITAEDWMYYRYAGRMLEMEE